MFDRNQIEKLLKLNGIETNAEDDEIKSVLLSARWHEDDVEAALLVLRENSESKETHVDSLHKVFRSDEHLRPETISALLGVEMTVRKDQISYSARRRRGGLAPIQIVKVAIISITLAGFLLLASMWYMEAGWFHYTLR